MPPRPILLLAAALLLGQGCNPPANHPDWLPPGAERERVWNHWRVTKDSLFLTDASPLLDEDRAHFTGLTYFPFDSTMAFAVALEPAMVPDTVRMATITGGGFVRFVRFGHFTFHVDGRPQRLTVFRSVDSEDASLFIPFNDPTNRRGTYGGGRYIDLALDPDGRYVLDFNFAYNPFCAYDPAWACPVPPAENRLTVPITAGEKFDG